MKYGRRLFFYAGFSMKLSHNVNTFVTSVIGNYANSKGKQYKTILLLNKSKIVF